MAAARVLSYCYAPDMMFFTILKATYGGKGKVFLYGWKEEDFYRNFPRLYLGCIQNKSPSTVLSGFKAKVHHQKLLFLGGCLFLDETLVQSRKLTIRILLFPSMQKKDPFSSVTVG